MHTRPALRNCNDVHEYKCCAFHDKKQVGAHPAINHTTEQGPNNLTAKSIESAEVVEHKQLQTKSPTMNELHRRPEQECSIALGSADKIAVPSTRSSHMKVEST